MRYSRGSLFDNFCLCFSRLNDFARLKAGLSLRLALLSNFKWARRPVYLLTPVLLRARELLAARGASSSCCVCFFGEDMRPSLPSPSSVRVRASGRVRAEVRAGRFSTKECQFVQSGSVLVSRTDNEG